MLETVCFGLAVILLVYFLIRKSKIHNLPPGPWGVPLFGVLPFMDKPPHIKFQEYFQNYGKICSFYVGEQLVVVLSDFALIKEALVKQGEIFAGRPKSFPFRVFPEDDGIVTTDGFVFKQFKSFIVSTLKDFGAVRQQFEAVVRGNAEHFVEYIKTIEGQTVDILEPLGLSIAQTYCHILLGKRMEFDDPIFKKLISLCYREQRCYDNGVRIFLPWTRKIPIISKLVGEDEIQSVKLGIYEILYKIIEENEETYVEGSRQTFIHAWFTEERNRKAKDPNDNIFSRRTMVHNIDIVFSAGYETTTTTLRWTFLFLLKHPHVQEKILEELDEVIGHDRFPSLDDIPRLPYTSATIQEVHRCATVGPLGLPHRNREATTLAGYHIPKSSTVYPNAYAVHTNDQLFPEPEAFRPERFISDDGKFQKSEYVIPFSMGKRQCPGENMAHTEIFLYLTHILQQFRIHADDDTRNLGVSRSGSLSAIPEDFKMKFVDRVDPRVAKVK